MKMKALLLVAGGFSLMLPSCSSVNDAPGNINPKIMGSRIEITGKAVNGKAGAILQINEASEPYYIDGLSEWPENLYGRLLRVEGEVIPSENVDTSTIKPEDMPTIISGPYKTIYNAKWEVVKKKFRWPWNK